MKLQKIRKLKLVTLLDNMVYISGPLGHWGYSTFLIYVDANNMTKRVLMDTGSDVEAFIRNTKLLKIGFYNLDAVVLSHGHLDHTTATINVVEAHPGIKIYAHPSVFSKRISIDEKGERNTFSPPKGWGLKAWEDAGAKIVFTKEPTEVASGIWVTGEVPRKSFETIAEMGRWRRVIEEDGIEKEDLIPDDQSIFFDLEGFGIVVLTGCAHSGVLNTLAYVEELTGEKPVAVIGGTHLSGRKPEYLTKTIEGLKHYNLKYLSPCHCTGFHAISKLAEAFPKAFQLNHSGKITDFTEFIKK